MNSFPSTTPKGGAVIWLVLLTGLAARFWVATCGHNFDFDSYRIVADLMAQGKNVYASTDRYCYGPGWFTVIHLLDALAGHRADIFRWLLIGFLSAADVAIALMLWRQFGLLAAAFFFLNPVSIIITGYHNQFDNVAICLGLLAVIRFGDDFEKPLSGRKWSALLLLGLSLTTKHVFFMFPFWLAVKQRGLLQKCLIVAVPTVIFLASFLPYWSVGHAGIIQNVFLYRSGTDGYLYTNLMPVGVQAVFSSRTLWLLALAFFAFVCREKNGVRSLLLYTGVLVALTPTIASQYFVIPLALLAVNFNALSILYTAIITAALAIGELGWLLKDSPLAARDGEIVGQFSWALYALLWAVIWIVWREKIVASFQWCVTEVNHQLGIEK